MKAPSLMTPPTNLPKAWPLMGKPQATQKARSTTPKPGHVLRRNMERDYGSTLGPQHPLHPRLSNRVEVRQERFSAADWLRLSGGAGYHIGITWCDALKLANMCYDDFGRELFEEVLHLRDINQRGFFLRPQKLVAVFALIMKSKPTGTEGSMRLLVPVAPLPRRALPPLAVRRPVRLLFIHLSTVRKSARSRSATFSPILRIGRSLHLLVLLRPPFEVTASSRIIIPVGRTLLAAPTWDSVRGISQPLWARGILSCLLPLARLVPTLTVLNALGNGQPAQCT
jgi:hypothetical protein